MDPVLFIHLDLSDLCIPVGSPLLAENDFIPLLDLHPYSPIYKTPNDYLSFDKQLTEYAKKGIALSSIIDFPRIKCEVEWVKREMRSTPKVIFYCTKQNHISEIKRCSYPQLKFFKNWNLEISLIPPNYKTISISDKYFHFTSQFKGIQQGILRTLNTDQIAILLTGGQLPSINMSLFLNLLPRNENFILLGYNPVNNDCFKLLLTSNLYEQRVIKEVVSLSEKYEYTAISYLSTNETVKNISKIGEKLLSLEWDEAINQREFLNSLLEGLEPHFQEESDATEEELGQPDEGEAKASSLLSTLLQEMDTFKVVNDEDSKRPAKLKLIYLSAKIKYFKHKSYADFLMRIFTMTEVLLLPEFSKLLNAGKKLNINLTSLIPDKKAPSIKVASIFKDDDWQKFVRDYIPHPYDWTIGDKCKPTFFLHRAVWECFFEKDSDFRKGRTLFLKDILNYIDALREIRNKVAHNLEGTGRDQILESLIDIDGDPINESRLFTPINRTEYSLKYDEYEAWLEKQKNNPESNDPKPGTQWTKDEKEKLRKLHETNFFTLCDKYFGIHQDDIPYDQNFGFFDTHINALIKYYLGITDNP